MRTIFFISLFFLAESAAAQTSLFQTIPEATLPYSTEQADYKSYYAGRRILHGIDSSTFINQLRAIKPIIVNTKGGTAFGELDCSETKDCLKEDVIGEVFILGKFRVGNSMLLHVGLKEKSEFPLTQGLLINIDSNGKVLQWLISDGSVSPGNPHGSISRDMTITKAGLIRIEESAWGDNSEHYKLKVIYQIIAGKDNSKKAPTIKLVKRFFN